MLTWENATGNQDLRETEKGIKGISEVQEAGGTSAIPLTMRGKREQT
jgi:hypothetical protein